MPQHPWIGKAKKIDDYDLPRIGAKIGVGEDEIHALLDVESRGKGFDSNGVIKLFEEHVFWRNLPRELRQRAVDLGLAWPKWRRNYANNHKRFLAAYAFDKNAALKACSWGLGQTLGENYEACGYNTPLQMVKAYAADEANQLEGMINFIIFHGLDDELRKHDWAGFARGYNGKYYYKNNYHTRLAERYAWWAKKPDTPWHPDMAKEEDEQAEDKAEGMPIPNVKPILVTERVSDKKGAGLAAAIAALVTAAALRWNEFTTWIGGLF
jgi:hypothetical protein